MRRWRDRKNVRSRSRGGRHGHAAWFDADAGIARSNHCASEDRGGASREAFFGSARRPAGAGAGLHTMSGALVDGTAQAIAAAIKKGAVSSREIAQETLDRIEARNGALGAFTDVTAKRARAKADAIDTARARGESLGPLAGA